MWEFFEHTADLGLRIRAADLHALFAEASQALFSAIVADLSTVQPLREVTVELPADDREYLLFDWLRRLLYLFDRDHLLFSRFEVHVGPEGLAGRAWGEPYDPSRHELAHEVKALTYHELLLEPTPEGWLAEIIVDI